MLPVALDGLVYRVCNLAVPLAGYGHDAERLHLQIKHVYMMKGLQIVHVMSRSQARIAVTEVMHGAG